jgi:hypothetical protein
MTPDDTHKQAGVAFSGDFLQRYESRIGKQLLVIKDWRAREFAAGRPSSIDDYCRAQALCPHCWGVGLARNEHGGGFKGIGWDGDIRLYERCENCNATGQLDPLPGTRP